MVSVWNRLGAGALSWRRTWMSMVFLAWLLSPAFAGEGLIVYVTPDSDVYGIGQTVNVTFTVINDTGRELEVISAPGCGITAFNLIVYDLAGQMIWHANQCPCLCCPCAPLLQEIPVGVSQYSNTWNQARTVRMDPCTCRPAKDPCGCVREPVPAGFYYLVGRVEGVMSEPALIEIQTVDSQ